MVYRDLFAGRHGDYQFQLEPKQDTCGCNTAALALAAKLSKHDIVHISGQNEVSWNSLYIRMLSGLCTLHNTL